MWTRTLSLFFFVSLVSPGQDPLTAPLLGLLRDAQRRLLPVYGMAGTFLPGAALRGGVVSAAFSGVAGMIKTDREIITLDGSGQPLQSFATPAGPALFAFDAKGQPAWSYLPATRQLLPIARDPVDLSDLPGEIFALRTSGEQIQVVVAREGALWLVRISPDGQVLAEDALPGLPASGPAILWGEDLIAVADGSDLVIRRGFADDQRVTLPAPARDLELLGQGWIRIGQSDDAPALALRLGKDGPQVYRLPALSGNAEAAQ